MMNMKKNKLNLFLLSLIAVISFGLYSCSSDDYEEATLAASSESVTFTNGGGEQTVTITTNRDRWVASSPLESSWLTLAQSGNTLTVTAETNKTGEDRKGIILVNAGDAALKINVTQSAGDAVIVMTQESQTFDFAGGEALIGVNTNAKDGFTVDKEDGADWLTVTYNSDFHFIKVFASANSASEERTAKFYVKAGTSQKEFVVTQTGVDAVVLPLLSKETSYLSVKAYEDKRGSQPIAYPDGLFNNAFYFATPNKQFPQVAYIYSDPSEPFTQAASFSLDASDETKAAIEKALTDKGFKLSGGTYLNSEIPYSVTVTEESGAFTIMATYTPVQDKDYPTFAAVPLTDPQMGWTGSIALGIHGEKYDNVKAWEATKGSTLDETISTITLPADDPNAGGFAWFETSAAEKANSLIVRAYWFNSDKGSDPDVESGSPYLNELNGARELYSDLTKAFWTAGGKNYLTKEFTKLLADAKFVYITTTSSGYMFYGRANDTYMDVLGFKIVKFSDYADGTQLLDFQTYRDTNDAASSVAAVKASPKKFVKLIKSINAHVKKGLKK